MCMAADDLKTGKDETELHRTRHEGKKDKNDNVISRTWEAAKESLGLGAWTERQESEAEKKR
ncbi:hypothetical protein [Candidatus Desulforudis audaxviator]|nr:hypothetical protein [Candidatus Desulforudis audaxviator]